MLNLLRLAALAVILAACGHNIVAEPSTPTTTTTPPAPTSLQPAEPPAQRTMYTGMEASVLPEGMTLVAMASGETTVYQAPTDSSPTTTVPATTILGTTTVLTIVEGPVDGWIRVMLPIRPNGSEGWVKADAVNVFVVEARIVVDLSDRALVVYEGDDVILTSPVAVGSPRNPTPTGDFFVTDSVTLSDPNSPWGPHALGLSARSDTITEYNGGDGIIGIHGTNRPGSIGNAASLGCVRLPNEVISQLHDLVPIGTPVQIRE